jgi:hypothetical protein
MKLFRSLNVLGLAMVALLVAMSGIAHATDPIVTAPFQISTLIADFKTAYGPLLLTLMGFLATYLIGRKIWMWFRKV